MHAAKKSTQTSGWAEDQDLSVHVQLYDKDSNKVSQCIHALRLSLPDHK